VTGEWIKLNNEILYNLSSSVNIIGVNKERRVCWASQLTELQNIKRGECVGPVN
jgi:hypothetical protein